MFQRNWYIGILFLFTVTNIPVYPYTFEELETWQDLLKVESVEILPDEEENPKGTPVVEVENKEHQDIPFFPLPVPFISFKDCPLPPNFPYGLEVGLGEFLNWAEDLHVSNLWTVRPRTAKEVVTLANWAYIYGYKLRAKGFSKSWSPLTVTRNSRCSNTVLVDTTVYLTQMKMIASKSDTNLRAVHVQTGTSIDKLMEFLAHHSASLFAVPVMGEATVGGVLAVGGHGVGAARLGTRLPLGHSAGSLSNLILSFKAVVWDYETQSYILKKFTRSDEDAKAFLTHLGRAFITDVRLLVGPPYSLRCESRFDFLADRLLSKPMRLDSDRESLAGLVERYSSVDLSVYPYSECVWALICTNTTRQQGESSIFINKPYPFSNYYENVPQQVSLLTSKFLSGFHYFSPLLSKVEYQLDFLNVKFGKLEDIWGPSYNILLRYKNMFKRTMSSGYAIVTNRARIQRITSEFYQFYSGLIIKYAGQWQFPQNEPLGIAITGVDDPADIPGLGQFDPPVLSPLAPMKGKDFDTAIFVSINALQGTPHYESFMRELESFLFLKFDGEDAIVRPEWSKAWAFTDMSAFENQIMLKRVIPASFGENWQWALQRFDYYDPYMIFSNDFLDSFLKANSTLKLKVR